MTSAHSARSEQYTEPELLAIARERAEAVLIGNGGELGLLGSNQAYQQVWARDAMICGLGLSLCANDEGRAIFRRSLDTLRRYQSPQGRVPHNVGMSNVPDPALIAHGGKLEADGRTVIVDTAHAGCIDNNLWYILGHQFYHRVTGDTAYLRACWPSIERALLWLRYQDSNECGLLEVHEAMDWADLFANRYNVLFPNALYVAVLRAMGYLSAALGEDGTAYEAEAEMTRQKVNAVLWVGPEVPRDEAYYAWIRAERKEWLYTQQRITTELVERPFYLPYVAFRDYADRFDTLGNLIAIVFGIASGPQSDKILDYIHGCGLNEPFPVKCLYPVLSEGDRDWREYYRVRNLNQPHHYHNGGIWPFIGGFYVAALVRAGRLDEARYQLGKLTAMHHHGKRKSWEFNEWHHGLSGRPMGYGGQSWSAAMYIYAHQAVMGDSLPFIIPPPHTTTNQGG